VTTADSGAIQGCKSIAKLRQHVQNDNEITSGISTAISSGYWRSSPKNSISTFHFE
jgi:hypothetical protein